MSQMSSTDVAARPVRVPNTRFTLRQRDSLLGYFLVAPLLAAILILVIYPFFFAIIISFTDRRIGGVGEFIGLGNYIFLLNQPDFQASIRNTILLVGIVQSAKLILGLGIAVLLNQHIRFRQMWRGLILLPWAMPAFVAFINWKLLYAPQGGAFNLILLNTGFFQSHIDFLSTRELALPSVAVALIWRGFPFWAISFLAALQNIPRELYEAAALDGANGWQRFRHVSLPGIRHIVLVVILVSTILTTNSFEAIFLMTGGGPSNATMTFPMLAYYGLQSLEIGRAAAVGVAMLPVFVSLAFVITVMLQKD